MQDRLTDAFRFQLQPIPGTTQIVFTASAHHSITGGSVAIVTPHRGHNGEQALEEHGCAYQTTRSITYLQPGETATCIGCHERRMDALLSKPILALQRPASRIAPGPDGT